MTDADAILRELYLLNRRLDLITARLPDRRADGRLGPFLSMVYDFAHATPWTAAELLQDARQAQRRDLLSALDVIVGDAGDPAKRLGCWLARHADAEAGDYRLERIKKERDVWLWSVSRVTDPARP